LIGFSRCAANDASSGRDVAFNKDWVVNPKGPGAIKWESAIETNANVIGMTVTNPELIDYLDYYNNRRRKAKLKDLPPALHRQQALSVA